MLELPAFRDRVDAPGWRDLVELAPQLMRAPRSLGQHVGGMVLSDSPLSGMVPIRAGAIGGRFIMDWDKDSVADANFAKIDLLSLPVLDQIEEGTRPHRGAGGAEAGPEQDRPRRSAGVPHDQRRQIEGGLPAPVARPVEDGPAPPLPQPPGPGLPGGPHPARRRRTGERGLPVRRALPPRRPLGVRPPAGAARPGTGLRESSSGRSRWSSSSWTWQR